MPAAPQIRTTHTLDPRPGTGRQIVGWKRGIPALREAGGRQVEMVIISHNGRAYRLDDEARCAHHTPEEVSRLPERCKCGFWATNSRAAARDFLYPGAAETSEKRPFWALLGVRGCGTVREGEGGWRAARQQVTSITFPNRCRRCKAAAEGVAAVPAAEERVWKLEPRCAQHQPQEQHPAEPVRRWWRLADLSGRFWIDIRFATEHLPTHPLRSRAWWQAAAARANRVAGAAGVIAGATIIGAVAYGVLARTEEAGGAAVVPALTLIWVGAVRSEAGGKVEEWRISRAAGAGVLAAGAANALGWVGLVAAIQLF